MKFKTTLALILILNTAGYCQEFAPIGSIWHFPIHYWASSSIGLLTIESVGDTIINNKDCKILYRDTGTFFGEEGNLYLHQDVDTIFQYNEEDNDFDRIMEFGTELGDTFLIERPASWEYGDSMYCKIDSISYHYMSTQDSVKIQHVQLFAMRINVNGDTIEARKSTKLFQNIGFERALLPLEIEWLADGPREGNMRCYEDDNIGLVMLGDVDCLFTPVEEISKNKIKVFPNPVIDALHMESNESSIENIQIYSLSGRLLREEIDPDSEIRLTNFQKGMYIIRIDLDEYSEFHKIVIQ